MKYPDERAFHGRADMYFNCPKATTSFHAGRVGDPPRDRTRWRRPGSPAGPTLRKV
ncbi:MAG TPA: hypothetical protein VHZ73_12355 [Vicinamibacterales bacterium]|nr:hypothetical protein [Vicinamibacterales bacterium]